MQLSDSICSRLLSCLGNLTIKKILKYQHPNVYGSVEIQMFIMSENNIISSCSIFDCCNQDRVYSHYIALR
jgi:hypothetical protein